MDVVSKLNKWNSAEEHKAVILGGGLAGLSLAVQLKQRQPNLPVLVIERALHPVQEAAHKVGESLVELSTYYFAEVLGLRPHLDKSQLPKLGLRFFFKPTPDQAGLDRLAEPVEVGAKRFPESPSYQIDRGIFENHLAEHAQSLGVVFVDGAKVDTVNHKKKEVEHDVQFTELSSGDVHNISCRWLIDACSRQSPIKRTKDLAKESAHKVSSVWFRIESKLNIDDIHPDQYAAGVHAGDNSRWFSTNHFMGDGYWVWFIPLSSGSTSVGIVVENDSHPLTDLNTFDKAMVWLKEHEPVAAGFVESKIESLQDFRVLKNFSHDCDKVYSRDRWFLTGEAGVFLDPFYSPGSDFIAISNTFITHLIEKDMAAPEEFANNAAQLDIFYLNLFKNTALIYQNHYPVFSHPVVMPVKIMWDFAVYWSFTAFLFMQGKFDSTESIFKLHRHFEEIGEMNNALQELLRVWAKELPREASPGYVDFFDFEYLHELSVGLKQELPNEEAFKSTFLNNISRLKALYQQLHQRVLEDCPGIEEKLPNSPYLDDATDHTGCSPDLDKILAQLVA